ncbi:odorant receptor 4-like [Venturia canescens]|uniref:odorant receptor 4-like n=1 Tax=Venturia canescens TaxID=32260 RepID=UPI001C9D2854|nr:odorant receptor 4-like [Venturia canescens]
MICFLTAPLFTSFVVAANGTVLISKSLPWSTGIFHDNVMKLYIWYTLQVPTALSAIVGIVAVNTAPLFYVMHAGIHMRLCQKNFESVTEKIIYSKDVEETFQSVIFAEIFTALVSTGGYCFLSQVVAKKDLPKMAFCMSGSVVNMFMMCWPPDSLRDESFKISHAAYNLDWYEWTRQEGKLIYIIIEKSQKPLVITANKLVVISLETFGWLLKSAFSMFTLLRQVME